MRHASAGWHPVTFGHWIKDYSFEDLTARTVLSIFSNIAEGFGRSTDNDKRAFLNDAKDSCAEFRS